MTQVYYPEPMTDYMRENKEVNERMTKRIEEMRKIESYSVVKEDGKLYWHCKDGTEFEITDIKAQRKDMI